MNRPFPTLFAEYIVKLHCYPSDDVDFNKVVDKVPHNFLIDKLLKYGNTVK